MSVARVRLEQAPKIRVLMTEAGKGPQPTRYSESEWDLLKYFIIKDVHSLDLYDGNMRAYFGRDCVPLPESWTDLSTLTEGRVFFVGVEGDQEVDVDPNFVSLLIDDWMIECGG
jgi:hypothetical protein